MLFDLAGNLWGPQFFGFRLRFGSAKGLLVTCAFAEAWPKAKNPRGSSRHLFCQCPTRFASPQNFSLFCDSNLQTYRAIRL